DPQIGNELGFAISGDTTLPTAPLLDGNARFKVSSDRRFDAAGVEQNRQLHFEARAVQKLPVTATLIGGTNFTGQVPIDVPVDEHYAGNIGLALRWVYAPMPIQVGDSYQMLVGYDDGSSEVLSAAVTAVLDPPTNLMISSGTTPTFSWSHAPIQL